MDFGGSGLGGFSDENGAPYFRLDGEVCIFNTTIFFKYESLRALFCALIESYISIALNDLSKSICVCFFVIPRMRAYITRKNWYFNYKKIV